MFRASAVFVRDFISLLQMTLPAAALILLTRKLRTAYDESDELVEQLTVGTATCLVFMLVDLARAMAGGVLARAISPANVGLIIGASFLVMSMNLKRLKELRLSVLGTGLANRDTRDGSVD